MTNETEKPATLNQLVAKVVRRAADLKRAHAETVVAREAYRVASLADDAATNALRMAREELNAFIEEACA